MDRSNKDVVGLYNPADPAVLKLISMAIQAADRKGVAINMCGQMSGSPLYTMLLLGMGLRRFQRHPERHSRSEKHLSQGDDRRMPGDRRPGRDDGERPRREELPQGRAPMKKRVEEIVE